MPALVTGASGFLGGRLAQMLVERGEQVIVLARPNANLNHLSAFSDRQVRVVRGSLADGAALLEACREATHLYHCAAASTDWASQEVYRSSNVTGTELLLDAAAKAPRLRRFIHVSTTDVYGYPEAPCDEDGPMRDAGLPYNQTKILGEQAVWRAHAKGLPVAVVRPATIYGPRGKAFVTDIAELLRQRQMALVGGGGKTAGLLYVDNAVDAMISAAYTPAALGRVYNLSDGTDATWKDYVYALAEGLGYKAPWIDLPYPVAMGIARAMEAPYHLFAKLPGRPLLTVHAVRLLGADQEFPAGRARSELDFAPRVSFAEGMARSVAWVRSGEA